MAAPVSRNARPKIFFILSDFIPAAIVLYVLTIIYFCLWRIRKRWAACNANESRSAAIDDGNINVYEVRRFAAVVAKTNGIETGHVSCNDSGFNLVPVYAKFGISPTGQCSHLLT